MRTYSLNDHVTAVDLGPVEVLFYHGRPVAFKHYPAKTLWVITERVARDDPFRSTFRSGWSGQVRITGGQVALEEKILEAIQSMPAPA
jgi:hypothetical protein